jgi:hypothetical protein
MISPLHRLPTTMQRCICSTKPGPTFSSRSVSTKLPLFTTRTLGNPIVSAGRYHTTPPYDTTTPQNISVVSSASISRCVDTFSSLAEATEQQLSRDYVFQSHIRQFYEEFRSIEQSMALNLPLEDRLKLGPASQPRSFVATRFSVQMELLATFGGVKPCTLFYTPAINPGQDTKAMFDRLVQDAVLPGFRHHRFDRYGFALFNVPRNLYIEGTPGNLRDYWVLADCRSKNWLTGITQSIFLGPHDQCCSMSAIGNVLGYPVLATTMGHDWRFMYIDKTATNELAERTGNAVGPVSGIEYTATWTEFQMQESLEHFEGYCKLAQCYGREYTFQSEPNPSLEYSLDHEFVR